MATWNDAVPTAANQVLADITAIRENLDELEAVVENLTGDTLGTDEPSAMQILYNKLGTYVDSDEALSGVSEKTFTGLESSKRYRLEFEIYWVSGSSPLLAFRFGNSGGIDTGNNYRHNSLYLTASAAMQYDNTADDIIKLSTDLLNDGHPFIGHIDFCMDPTDDTKAIFYGQTYGFLSNTPLWFNGGYDGASTIDRIQLMLSDVGTFSGRVRLFRTN